VLFRSPFPDVPKCTEMEWGRLADAVDMLIEGQCVVDRHSKALEAMLDWNADGPDVDCCDRLFNSLSCAGADDHRLCLVRIQVHSIHVEPATDCVETVGQIRHCFGVTECDVELCVVRVLNMADPEGANNTSDW
jgi:hypothetical protein